MGKFCGKCGAPVDPTTGQCVKCNATPTMQQTATPNYENERLKAEQAVKLAEEKAKAKEERKRAWAEAKKRYKDDASAKKEVLKTAKKEKKKAKLAAMSKKKKFKRICLKILIILLILALVGGGIYLAIKNLGILSDDKKSENGDKTSSVSTDSGTDDTDSTAERNPPTGDMPDAYRPSRPNADNYFKDNSKIVSQINASTAGRTEAEAYKNLTGRGFTNPITTQYAMDGTYSQSKEIKNNSNDKHPLYSTFYVSQSGFAWSITEINGAVFASPLTYNMEYDPAVEVLFSETANVTSYDSTLNKFYVTAPNANVLNVKVIKRIDAATLETITADTIMEMEVVE